MFAWVTKLWNWFLSLFQGLLDFLGDMILYAADGFLTALSGIISSIPIPNFLGQTLGDYLSHIDPGVLFFLSQSGFSAAIGILGAGVAFRLTRKLFTLGQW